MKTLLHAEDVVCAWAARRLGRPVRWRATRIEEFQAASHGRDQQAEAELALDAEGRILGLRVRIAGNVGAYVDDGTMVVVEKGRNLIGRELNVTVTTILQTNAGRMIFAKYEA